MILHIFKAFRDIKQRIVKQEEERVKAQWDAASSNEAELRARRHNIEREEHKISEYRKDIEDLNKRVSDRKAELEHANQELREQIRMIEAKAAPNQIWATAFTSGFNKAWDMMIPLQMHGIDLAISKIKSDTTDKVLRGLEPAITNRLNQASNTALKPANLLIVKKREFEAKLSQARVESDKLKYKQYLEVIGWILNGQDISKK